MSQQDNPTPNASAESGPSMESNAHAVGSGRAMRIGLLTLLLGFGGFLVWAAYAPLDEGVPTSGMVSIDTKRKAVQHLTGGIVREVLVREGDTVEKGQVLMRLDQATTKANYEAVRQRYLGLRAMQGRLLAEQAGSTSITFHPDLLVAKSDPLIAQQIYTQEQLFRSRKAALAADLRGIEESIQGQQALLQSYKSILDSRRRQSALLSEELANTRALVKEGYAPRNRQLELERMSAESSAAIADLLGNLSRATSAIGELRQRAILRRQEYRKEVESQLGEVTPQVLSDAEKLVAAKADLDRVEIRSPAAGQVVGLAFQTVGGVIPAGQKLMDIVPQQQDLLLESRVPPHLIDKVGVGQLADIRFSTFAHSPTLVIEGKLVSISGDLLVDPQNPQIQYYLARVAVTLNGMKTLGNRKMQPGMPVEIIVKTGERSLLQYLLHPLTKRIAASLKEE